MKVRRYYRANRSLKICAEKTFSENFFFLEWKMEGSLTHVILVVDYGVICFAAGVSMY